MADPRFFSVSEALRLDRIAQIAGAELAGAADPGRLFSDVAGLGEAGPSDVSFLDNKRYQNQFAASKAGACIVDPAYAGREPKGMALLLTPKPHRAYALVAQAFYPKARMPGGHHGSAQIDPSARIGEGTWIGAGVVIGAGAEIGRNCMIKANAVIEDGVIVGDDTEIGPNASLSYCLVGKGCQIHAGVCIGNRGFGFTMDPEGFLDVPQLGRVIIEDNVEIGANSTVDRGAGPDTVIGAGTKIDNLVQIGHNVRLGRSCVLVGQSGIAGSAILEDYVVAAAQSGVSGHITVGKGAKLAGKSGVIRDVAPGQSVAGAPAMPVRDYFRLCTMWQRQLKAKGKCDE